jgi:hypothetical protein
MQLRPILGGVSVVVDKRRGLCPQLDPAPFDERRGTAHRGGGVGWKARHVVGPHPAKADQRR